MTALRVHSLHALAYCERLFYLEEVENMRVADERQDLQQKVFDRVHVGEPVHGAGEDQGIVD